MPNLKNRKGKQGHGKKVIAGVVLPPRDYQNKESMVLDRIAQWYVEGKTQYQIAELLVHHKVMPSCSQKTVCLKIEKLRERWVTSALNNYDQAKAEELAKINNMERVAWEQFWKSCEVGYSVTRKVEKQLRYPLLRDDDQKQLRGRPMVKADPEEPKLKTTKVVTERARRGELGDVRFLEIVRWCVEMRCKIFGLTRPDVNVTNNTLNVKGGGPSWDDLFAIPEAKDEVSARLAEVEALPPAPVPDAETVKEG